MSIFGRIWKAVTTPASVILFPFLRQIKWFATAQRVKADELLKHYAHWPYICSTRNASAVASCPLRLYVTTSAGEKQYKHLRKGKDTRSISREQKAYLKSLPSLARRMSKAIEIEEVVEHPFLDLWRTVNPWHNGFDTLELIQIYLEMTGNAYLYVWRGPLGIPQELWVLPSQFMTIVPDKDKFILGYLYGRNKHNAKALTPDEVVHFKFPNPNDMLYGHSPLQACFKAVQRKEGMDELEESLLKNNARPDFVILTKGRVREEDKRKLREQWRELYGTKQGRGRPAVLDKDATIQKIGFTPKEMQYLQGQRLTMEEIAGAYGMPISKLIPDSKYANAKVGEREWKTDAIRPRHRRLEDKFNEKLITKFDGRLFVAFDNCVPEDEEFKLRKRESDLGTYVKSINQVREEEGLEAVPWGEVPLVPLTLYPFGSAPAPPAEEEGEEEELAVGTAVLRRKALDVRTPSPPELELPRMKRIMRKIYKEIRAEVLNNLRGKAGNELMEFVQKYGDRGRDPHTHLTETEYRRQRAQVIFEFLQKQEGVSVDLLMFSTAKWRKLTGKRMGPPIKAQLIRGAKYGSQQIGIGIFDVLNPETQRWLSAYVAHFAAVTTRELGLKFSATLAEGIEAGETIRQIEDRVNSFFGRMERHKSEMIARSESTRATHQGMERSWQESGVVVGKQWEVQPGACQYCQAMEGTIIPLGTSYFDTGEDLMGVDGGTLDFGYENVDGPPLHPNCECTLLAVLEE